mgnify:CR=1 FL=1
MDQKLEKTVSATIEALARIERFIEKYGGKLSRNQKDAVAEKLQELQKTLDGIS